jgi:hypothetical protein
VKKLSPWLFVVYSVLLSVPLGLAKATASQAPPLERVFPNSKPEVDKAIQELHASISGRLPTLDGFVETAGQTLDRYERGYYQCVLQVTSEASGGTLVRVTAKITAWYADSNPAQSGYRTLPSNGRLETDLLDRLEDLLAKKATGPATAPRPAAASTPPAARTSESPPTSAPAVRPKTANASVADKSAVPRSTPPVLGRPGAVAPAPAEESAAPRARDEDLSSLKQQREEAEKRMRELNSNVQNLEEILHNQTHPTDLVVVRKSGTPVFAKPQANTPVLFSADAEDEFELLDRQGSWMHVQISGASRGWVRRAQVDLPEGFADSSYKGSASDPPDDAPFRLAREETHAFPGDWQQLRGKSVRIIWVEPASTSGQSSSAQAKRDFAKSLFLKAYKEVSAADQTVAGVVIVFDSADGGQISATLSSLAQWQAGNLSEALFWQQCSLDPPQSFEIASKP